MLNQTYIFPMPIFGRASPFEIAFTYTNARNNDRNG